LQAAQKHPGARRAKNRRAEAYLQYVAARRLSGNEADGFFISKRDGSVKRATTEFSYFAVIFEKMTSVFRL
jgi:hypothetical protein